MRSVWILSNDDKQDQQMNISKSPAPAGEAEGNPLTFTLLNGGIGNHVQYPVA